MALIYPALRIMLDGTAAEFMVGQAMIGVPIGMALGLQRDARRDLSAPHPHHLDVGRYSLSLALSGGAMPLVSEWLFDRYHDPFLPMYFILAYGMFGICVVVPMRETNTNRLDV